MYFICLTQSLILPGRQDSHTLAGAHSEAPATLRPPSLWRTSKRKAEWWDTSIQSSQSTWPSRALPLALTWQAGDNPVRPGWTWQAVTGQQPGGHGVYWNSVTFVAQQPTTVVQKENPGSTVDFKTVTSSPGQCRQLPSAAGFPLWLQHAGVFEFWFHFQTFWVQVTLRKVNNNVINLVAQQLSVPLTNNRFGTLWMVRLCSTVCRYIRDKRKNSSSNKYTNSWEGYSV